MNNLEKAFIILAVQKEAINFPKQAEHINKLAFELYDILFKNNEIDRKQNKNEIEFLKEDSINKIPLPPEPPPAKPKPPKIRYETELNNDLDCSCLFIIPVFFIILIILSYFF